MSAASSILLGLVALGIVPACNGSRDPGGGIWADGGADEGATTGAGDDAGDHGSGPGEDTGAADDGSGDGRAATTGILLDVGSPETGEPTCDPQSEDCSCTAVDILFVIDNSGSMFVHQQRLAEVFPLFVDVMIEALPPGTDLHVGITTQGGFWSGAGSGSWSAECVTDASPYPEGYAPPTGPANGTNGDQGRLYEHDGKRFFALSTDDDPQALKAWFSAAATLPQADSPQQDQVELLAAAGAYPFHSANAAFNDGFLRDEGAVLLIFYLTDTSDITPESATDLADVVRAAKSGCGGDECILTGGMINPNAFCLAEYPRLEEFLQAFGKPPAAVGSILGNGGAWPPQAAPVADYQAVLGDALAEVVAQTCEAVGPPEG